MLVIGGGDGEGRWLGAPYTPHKHFGLEVVVVVRARTMLRPSSYLGDAILPCTYILYYVYLPDCLSTLTGLIKGVSGQQPMTGG